MIPELAKYYLWQKAVNCFFPEGHAMYDNDWRLFAIRLGTKKPFGLENEESETWTESIKLKLRPTVSMTDEEVLTLCKFVDPIGFGDYRYSKWQVEKDIKNSVFKVTNKKSKHSFDIYWCDGSITVYETYDDGSCDVDPIINNTYWEWYYRNGFDAGMYPTGQTMYELGLAVYSPEDNKMYKELYVDKLNSEIKKIKRILG